MDVDSATLPAPVTRLKLLQWSHVLMDVDRADFEVYRELPDDASMEPRPDGRG